MATALEKIIGWAGTLRDWQSDAVRRLLTASTLDETDKREIVAMLKARHGLEDPQNPAPKPLPLKAGDISGAQVASGRAILKEIAQIRNVNALTDGTSLQFGHQGLTVIYGENGTGKSGFARVLKRACKARDEKEVIHPNINATGPTGPASAVFHIQIDGVDQQIPWQDGRPSPDALASICVFDGRCARVIIDEDNEAHYLPFGAHVFEELVGLLKEIRSVLQAEKPLPQRPNWPDIPLDTPAGKFVAQLSAATDLGVLREWTEDDEKKLLQVAKCLSQAEADDPAKTGRRLRNLAARLRQLAAKLTELEKGVPASIASAFSHILTALAAANQALEAAPQAALADGPLPGIGGDAWQLLYRAAREYSIGVAYPGKEFPYVGQDGRCVLCMQPLSEPAKDRLLQFRDFMEQTAKKAVDDLTRQLAEARQKLPTDDSQTLEGFKDAVDEFASRRPAAAQTVPLFAASVAARAKALLCLTSAADLGCIPALAANPTTQMSAVASAMEGEAVAAERTGDAAVLSGLRASKRELDARKALLSRRHSITKYVRDLRMAGRYDRCIVETEFRHVTLTGKLIISEALTPELQKALQSELQELGASHHLRRLDLRPVASQGETSHRLEMKSQRPIKASLTDILSEGEQRVVAIAGFLAELNAAGHQSPIVLDDPVSSLDHRFRSKIAERLVAEAAKRQVIVFTHDLSFLLEVMSFQKEFGLDAFGERFGGVAIAPQTVERKNEVTGYLTDGLPWCAASVGARLGKLLQELKRIEPLHQQDPDAYNREAADIYGRLRETWEAFVEETLFDGVVQRHDCRIKTQKLEEVTVTTADAVAVNAGMTKTSNWMTGHNKARPLDVNRPDPSEIRKDIEALQVLQNSVKDRRKRAKKDFETALAPPVAPKGASPGPSPPS